MINEADSLKTTITSKDEKTTWTQELDGEKLITPIDKIENVSVNVKIENEMFLQDKKLNPPVYPYIENFGSLDITYLTPALLTLVSNFSDSFCAGFYDFKETLINPDYYFNYVFFRYDLIKNYNSYFGIPYPEATDDEEKITIFNKYLIGEPFISTELIQIPIRFYGKQGFLDVQLFVVYSNSEFKINQIDIIGWERKNG